MNKMCGAWIAVAVLVSFGVAEGAGKPSKISGYGGDYKGTINFGGVATAKASGKFKASKRKENGALTLKSNLVVLGTAAALMEKYSIRGRKFRYTLTATQGGTTVTGGGTGKARVSGRTIRFSSVVSFDGQVYNQSGTLQKTRKGLDVDNNLSGMGGALILYKLKEK